MKERIRIEIKERVRLDLTRAKTEDITQSQARPPQLDEELLKDRTVIRRVIQDDEFAQQLYAALCNMRWKKDGTDYLFACSWRFAGDIVASMRGIGETYQNFYCRGGEGTVHREVKKMLKAVGWTPNEWPEEDFAKMGLRKDSPMRQGDPSEHRLNKTGGTRR